MLSSHELSCGSLTVANWMDEEHHQHHCAVNGCEAWTTVRETKIGSRARVVHRRALKVIGEWVVEAEKKI